MKQTPMARTTGTLNIPLVSTPAPYNNRFHHRYIETAKMLCHRVELLIRRAGEPTSFA
jgi:hypothetical protein